jgi:hypothetical protein
MNPTIALATAAGAALLAGVAFAQSTTSSPAGSTQVPTLGSAGNDAAAAANSPSSYGPNRFAVPNAPNPAFAGVGPNTTSGASRPAAAGQYGVNTAATAPAADTRSTTTSGSSSSTKDSGSARPAPGEHD